MPALKERIKDLFHKSIEDLTQLIDFKKTTVDAYQSHIKASFDKTINFKNSYTKESLAKDTEVKMLAIKSIQYPPIIYKTTLVYAVASFEAFLNKFLTILYEEDNRRLKTNSKQMSYDELLSHRSLKTIKKKMIENVLHDLFYKSIADQFNIINNKFGLGLNFVSEKTTFFDNNVNLSILTETYSLRNIILHNDSIINEVFIQKNPSSKWKLRQKVTLNAEFTHNKILYLIQMVAKISFRILNDE